MRNFEEIVARIEFIRKSLGMNKSRFCRQIGLTPQTYHNFVGPQGSKPSLELIRGVFNRFQVNPIWLLNGSGEPFGEAHSGAVAAESKPAWKRFSQDQLCRILEITEDAIISVDEEQRLILFNKGAEKIFGYSEGEVLGRHLEVLLPEISREIHRRHFASFAMSPEKSRLMADRGEVLGKRKDGVEFSAEVTISKFEQGDRKVYTAILRDITQRKQLEHQQGEMEKRILQPQTLESLGVLAGSIAHDFNNLLMGILANAAVAMKGLPPDSPEFRSIRGIETAAKRAAEFCGELLAYSGRAEFIVEPIDVNDMVKEMAHLLEFSISKKAHFKLDLRDNLPAINAEVAQIRQVIMNLIINASEAIGNRTGTLTLATGAQHWSRESLREMVAEDNLPEGHYVTIEVADTGVGMDDDMISKIFDPFFTTKATGRGLGLAALLGIVRAHRGAIKISSRPGSGTTFSVLLPAATLPARESQHEEEAKPDREINGTILIVDDEKMIRDLLSSLLQKEGIKVLTAEDGPSAIKKFRENQDEIDFVLLDLTMPNMDGAETFRELLTINSKVRVILSSGFSEQEVFDRLQGELPVGFIQKPYRIDTLIAQFRRAMNRDE